MKTKLTHAQILDIYSSKEPYSIICSKYLLSKGYVSAIKNGRNLRHITKPLRRKKRIKRGKLTEEEREIIRTSDKSVAKLAKQYNVSKSNIYQLRSRKKAKRQLCRS